MFKTVDYRELQSDDILVDVRSPGEYEEATIPGAVNVPLFDNEERKVIGTVYVQESVEKAKRLGLEYVGKKLPMLYDELKKLEENHKLILFCARGGLRSSSVCSLMMSLGLNVFKLRGGYKGYRKIINEELPKLNEKMNYIVLHGNTGVGKTEVLKNLASKGYDVLDLEEAANHRGSLLGSVGLGAGRSQKQFEAIVHDKLKQMKGNHVFVEAESKRIGNIVMLDYIPERMRQGVHILLRASLDFRSELLVKEYVGKADNEEIVGALDLLKKHMSEKNIERFQEMLQQGEYKALAVELMEKYYDPLYAGSQKKYEYDRVVDIESIEEASGEIIRWVEENYGK